MDKNANRLAIIGGGAAGLAAAVAAGERARELGFPLEITIFERDDRVGRSILATGNGRCNFSNSGIRFFHYHNFEFVGQAIGRIAMTRDDDLVHSFFGEHGLVWREESEGRQYPQANKASVVVDVLRASAAAVGAHEACGQEVASIDPPRGEGKPFTLRMSDGVFERADAVIVACGGKASSSLAPSPAFADTGFVRTRPILGPLRCVDKHLPYTRELDNIRVRCKVSIARYDGDCYAHIATERGELMFRKYGVSGICVYDLSRFAEPGDMLIVNFLPDRDANDVDEFMEERARTLRQTFGDRLTYGDVLRGLVLPRVADVILKRLNLKATEVVDDSGLAALGNMMTMFCLDVAGIGDADQCQVTRGGFSVEDFDPQTMESRSTPGLFVVGEALDVDGRCGGYNLHWAWSSGLIAGRTAAEGLTNAFSR